jgi:hypothetical protein
MTTIKEIKKELELIQKYGYPIIIPSLDYKQYGKKSHLIQFKKKPLGYWINGNYETLRTLKTIRNFIECIEGAKK